jgi:hypothetical protein
MGRDDTPTLLLSAVPRVVTGPAATPDRCAVNNGVPSSILFMEHF